jgi:hypothetical protein
MADVNNQTSSWLQTTSVPEATSKFIAYIATALLILTLYSFAGPKATRLPVINRPKPFELTTNRVKKEWLIKAREIICDGIQKFPGKPFNMIAADVGMTTVLPPEYANEIRNNTNLSFVAFMAHVRGPPSSIQRLGA